MSHSLPFGLPWGRGTLAYFAQRPATRLIIFIHGFGGSAIKTWSGMEELLDEPAVENADIIFYGYRSLAASANNSAGIFRDFVSTAAEIRQPWSNALRRGGAMGARDYEDILIVAHSLGAAVTRRALLDALGMGADWVSRARLLLFGPAHMGTNLVELAGLLRSSPGALFFDLLTFARMRSPVLNDLKAGSPFLVRLLSDSEKAVTGGGIPAVVAESVVFGETDYVVVTEPFCRDPLPDVWQDEDHCSVCRTGGTLPAVRRHL